MTHNNVQPVHRENQHPQRRQPPLPKPAPTSLHTHKAPHHSTATASSRISRQEYEFLSAQIQQDQKKLDALEARRQLLSQQLKQMQKDHQEELRQRDEQHQAELKVRDDRLAALERQLQLLLENRS